MTKVAKSQDRRINNHFLLIVDLQESHWDWTKGEPFVDNLDYYLRYNKSFNRMGGAIRYVAAGNRDFLLGLVRGLRLLILCLAYSRASIHVE